MISRRMFPGATAVVLCLACLLWGRGALAQPVRPVSSVAGIVVAATENLQPVRRAVVTLSPATGLLPAPPTRTTVTDDEGRFVFSTVVPNTYLVTAEKAPYLATQFGATIRGGRGTPVTVEPGRDVTGLRIRMQRGAVITGVVTDINGEPARNVEVRIPDTETFSVTDDRGAYRLFGLEPGTYVIAAGTRYAGPAMATPSTEEIDAILNALRTRVSTALLPGRIETAPATLRQPAADLRLVPTFYPGTADRGAAVPVTIAVGEERTSVDIPLVMLGAGEVDGRIIDIDGSPARGVIVSAVPAPVEDHSFRGGPISTDGSLHLRNLSPGRWIIAARKTSFGETVSTGPRDVGASRLATAWATTEVEITAGQVLHVTLQLQLALTMTGRVVFDGVSLSRPSNLSAVRVGLGVATVGQLPSINAPSAAVRPDGTFEVTGILPGRYPLDATSSSGALSGWWLRSAMSNGRDLLDFPPVFDPSSQGLRDVVLTFSDRSSTVTGLFQDASGGPAPAYSILLFAGDPAYWTSSRRIAVTRPATNGRFSFDRLVPGDYVLVAMSGAVPNNPPSAEILETLVGTGLRISVGEGARVVQDLRISSRP